MDKERHFPQILNSFWLKIVALLTMTIDHIGYMMIDTSTPLEVIQVFRTIGRLALPLFCFMIAEGAHYTRSFKKYALRLGVMASVVSVIIIGSYEIPFFRENHLSMKDEGVIFIDLLLGALSVYFLKQEKWYFKLLAILPLLYGVGSFIACEIDYCGCYEEIWWFPYFMRTQYGWYGVLLIIAFFCARYLTTLFIKFASSITQIPYDAYEDTYFERNTKNIISALLLVAVTILFYTICFYTPRKYAFFGSGSNLDIQLFAVFSGVFILLYNGLRGYNKKWFQYGSYIYYLFHMLVIAIIFYLISLM